MKKIILLAFLVIGMLEKKEQEPLSLEKKAARAAWEKGKKITRTIQNSQPIPQFEIIDHQLTFVLKKIRILSTFRSSL